MVRIHERERITSSTNGTGKAGYPHVKKLNRRHFISDTKINTKWIKDLIRPETVKLLEANIAESIEEKLHDTGLGNTFTDMTPKAQVMKPKINKFDYIKLKSFCTAKETISKVKSQPIAWEKISANISDKRLISKIYKKFLQLISKKKKTTTTNKQKQNKTKKLIVQL